jgi:hypothetical protein
LRIFHGKNDNDRVKTQCFGGKKLANVPSIRFLTECVREDVESGCAEFVEDGFWEFACLIYGDQFYEKPTIHPGASER